MAWEQKGAGPSEQLAAMDNDSIDKYFKVGMNPV